MDLKFSSESYSTVDWTWLASKHGLDAAKTVTLHIPSMVKATHYPEGRAKPGLLLAKYTGGANAGLWAPYVQDGADGLDAALMVLIDDGVVREAGGEAISTVCTAAAIHHGQVYLDKLPATLLADGTTEATLTDDDLPAGITAVSL